MHKIDNNHSQSIRMAAIICGLASLFYLYEFFLQVCPAVMTTELMAALNIGASGLGTISAFFYYAYAPMQLPAGILYDRFGPRRVMSVAILVVALGALVFSIYPNLVMASAGRFMMGFGAAFSFIGVLLLISRWFHPRYFAMLAGVAQLFSSLGAISGQVSLAALVDHVGWRPSILSIGLIGLLLALAVYLVVRDHPPWYSPIKPAQMKVRSLQGLRNVLSERQSWYIAIYAFCSWAPILVFAALWGVNYIAQLYHVSTTVASSAVAMIWVGIGIASPLTGWISDQSKRRKPLLFSTQALGFMVILFILYVPNIPLWLMYILLFFMGAAAAGQALCFGVVKDINNPKVVGTAIGFNNMAVVAGGALLQPLAGLLLEFYWSGERIGGVPIYSVSNYQDAMFILPLCYLIAMLMSSLFIHETHCQHIFDINKQKDRHPFDQQHTKLHAKAINRY